jgi:chemotaxis protein CheC
MSIEPFNDDQRDALQEVTNVAMGQAGSSLAQLLNTFVVLSVPRSRIVDVTCAPEAVAEMVGARVDVTAVRQAFFHQLRGEAIALYGSDGCRELADLMGYSGQLDASGEQELLLDVTNILVGACLAGIAEQVGVDIGFAPPVLMAAQSPIEAVLNPDELGWSHALLIEVNFGIEQRGFTCHLIVLMPEDAIEYMRSVLDRILESL